MAMMQTIPWFWCVLLVLWAAAPALAAEVQQTILPNGLRVLTKEIRTSPAVTVQVWYGVGSRDEVPGGTGLAHQLEHLLFKGTKARPVQFGRLFNALGADANAFTSFDQTAYYATAGSDKLEALLQLEADRMRGAVIDAPSLAGEKTVVLSELDGRQNNPRSVLNEMVLAKVFSRHPYRITPIGERKDVEAFTVDQVRDFYRRHYGPNNATLIVVGDFETAGLLDKVRRYFGSIEPIAGFKPLVPPVEPPQSAEQRVELRRPGRVPALQVLYRTPAANDPDVPAIDVLDTILTNGRSSRLFKALIETGLATGAGGSQSTQKDPGWYSFSITPRQDPETVLKALDATLAEVRSRGVTAAELARAREQVRVGLLLGKDSIEAQANLLGSFQTTFGDYRKLDTYLQRIDRVGSGDIRRVLQKYFEPANRTVGVFIPTDGVATAPQGTPETTQVTSYASGQPVDFDAVSRYLPTLGQSGPVREPRPVEATLPNGIRVQVLRNPSAPTVSVLGRFQAGSAFENPERAGIAGMVGALLDEGTRTRSADELAMKLEDQGIRLGFQARRENTLMQATALAEDLDLLMALGADVVRNPIFPEKELERVRAQYLTSLANTLDSPAGVAQRTFYSLLYPPAHPFHTQITEASLKAITRADLVDFHRRFYRPRDFILTVVGDVDPKRVIEQVRTHFGDWQVEGPAPELKAAPVTPALRREAVVLPGKREAQVILGGVGIARTDPDYYAVLVMNDILGGNTLSSRLGARVRDQLGLTYGVYSRYAPGELAGPFTIQMQTNPTNVERAVAAVGEELERFRKDGPTEAELTRARRSLIDRFPLALTDNAGVANLLLEETIYGLGRDYPTRFVRSLEALKVEDIRRVANRLLQPEAFTTVVVSPNPAPVAKPAASGP